MEIKLDIIYQLHYIFFFQQETRPLIEATKRNRSSKEQAPKEEKGKIKIKNRSIKKLQLIQIS